MSIKKITLSKTGLLALFSILSISLSAQKSIANLIVEGYNEGPAGFPELMKQSHTEAVISYLNDDVVKQYEGANKVYFIFFENQESVLAPGKKFTQNLMRIDAKSFETDDKKWEEVKEFLLAGLKNQVDYFDRTFGASLQHTPTFELDPNDEKNNGWIAPRFKVYFYPKAVTLPEIATLQNIEKQLNALPYFSLEVHKRPFSKNIYNMHYTVSGASEQH